MYRAKIFHYGVFILSLLDVYGCLACAIIRLMSSLQLDVLSLIGHKHPYVYLCTIAHHISSLRGVLHARHMHDARHASCRSNRIMLTLVGVHGYACDANPNPL